MMQHCVAKFMFPFSHIIVGLLSTLWVSDSTVRKWILPRPCEVFCNQYNTVNEKIKKISCMDDLISGEKI